MRVKLVDRKAALPSYSIHTYGAYLDKIKDLDPYLYEPGYAYAFSYEESNKIIGILAKNKIEFEVTKLAWYEQILTKINNLTFATEAEAVSSLCAVEGPSKVTSADNATYKVYLPPNINGGAGIMYIHDRTKDTLGPAFDLPFKGDIAEISHAFLLVGQYRLEFRLLDYVSTIDVDVQYDISVLKDMKVKELNENCNAAVLAGFQSSAYNSRAYTFDFDYEAQINFSGIMTTINSGLYPGTQVEWKAHEVSTPLIFTIDQFKQLYMDGLTHKMTTIGKYRALKEQVAGSNDYGVINSIQW